MLIITPGMYLLGEFGVLEKTRSFFFFKLILFLNSPMWTGPGEGTWPGTTWGSRIWTPTNPSSGWLGGQSWRKWGREALGPGGGWGAGRAETPRRGLPRTGQWQFPQVKSKRPTNVRKMRGLPRNRRNAPSSDSGVLFATYQIGKD